MATANPEKTNNEMNMIVGKLWKKMTTADRQIYIERSDKDKIRYIKELLEYNRENPDEPLASKINPPKGYYFEGDQLVYDETRDKVNEKRLRRDQGHLKGHSQKREDSTTGFEISHPKDRPLSKYSFYSRQVSETRMT